ncbi:histidine-type phosphatase [Hoylesella nanceiensis]|uniref:histidine-type phosphatase n=1 Tax=Hoylesella nanceiensis TaxID=425941 RepID=UPI0028EDB830|nr:histidine-type phosphatase [Hoylesella nanceiensis]
MKRKYIFLSLLLLSLWLNPITLTAQIKRSDSFKEKYSLKEVVVLSRHNIRSPLSNGGSVLGKLTPHQWTDWSSSASELTLRGGALETIMGQFFRKWLVKEGLFQENYVPLQDEMLVYANSMQRTIATARYFSAGFMPIADIQIHHRFSPSKMDPIFFPRLTKVSEEFKKEALKQIAAMGGKRGIVGINEELKSSYDIIENTLDLKSSPACKEGIACSFDNYNTKILLELGEEPQMKGSLKLANTASDAFILQYYEESDAKKAAFGHDLTLSDWEKIAKVKDVYGDVLFAAPIVAVNVAHPLLVYINDELNADKRKFTFLCGHDSNIASVGAALGIEPYSLPNTIEKKTPIGCKLVFEKWVDKKGEVFVALNLVYQSTDQLRGLKPLDLKTPPMVFELKLKGLTPNNDGLYTFKDVNNRFVEAIRAYENIK